MRFIIVATLGLLISGCASSGNSGKFDYKTPEVAAKPKFGYLKIHTYSHLKEQLAYSTESDEPETMVFAPYRIYGKDGALVKKVRSTEIAPATVKLPEGEYVIVAEMSKEKVRSFTVDLEPGIVLEVDATMLKNSFSQAE